jgi:hypothetical protein
MHSKRKKNQMLTSPCCIICHIPHVIIFEKIKIQMSVQTEKFRTYVVLVMEPVNENLQELE